MTELTDDMLTLTHATERDVDLLLVEELKCSSAFVAWFVSRVIEVTSKVIAWEDSHVSHSKRRLHNRREIDITLQLRGGASTTLLIENKLDTDPQHCQAESYREEALAIVAQREAMAVFTVLVAPEAYLRSTSGFAAKFDATVSYEAMSEFLAGRARREDGEIARRLHHRHSLMDQAVTKARRGYQAVPLAPIKTFNAKYVALLRDAGVDLEPGTSMLKEGRPGESKTMIFAPAALPKWACLPQTRLVHQLREGNAKINFYGWGGLFTHLASVMAVDLRGTPYRPVPTTNKRVGGNSGLMLVVDTPPVDNLEGFDAQRAAILEGVQATSELRRWFLDHRDAVERWARAAAAATA